jgi:hypothetical protein
MMDSFSYTGQGSLIPISPQIFRDNHNITPSLDHIQLGSNQLFIRGGYSEINFNEISSRVFIYRKKYKIWCMFCSEVAIIQPRGGRTIALRVACYKSATQTLHLLFEETLAHLPRPRKAYLDVAEL